MSLNLYEIATEYRLLADKLIDADLDEQTKLDTLESIGGDLEVKIANIGYMIRQFDAESEMAKAESKRIADMAKTRENASKRLKEWLVTGMIAAKKEEVITPAFTVKMKTNQPAVIINNQDIVPDEYIRTKIEQEPNKQLISTALKAGIAVPGCHLESKQTVVIK